jgi:hypothetical protein
MKAGKPYYKVSPTIFEDLLGINIDIDSEYLKSPHPVFEVKFPKGALRENDASPEVEGMLVAMLPPGRFELVVPREGHRLIPDTGDYVEQDFPTLSLRLSLGVEVVEFEGMKVESPTNAYLQFNIRPNKTIAQCFEEKLPMAKNMKGYFPSEPFQKEILRLACAVCFLANYNSDLLSPDIPRKDFKRYREAKRRNDAKTLAEIDHRRVKVGMGKGWVIGQETEGETPPVIMTSDERHRELKHRHFRSPHLRLQPVGPRAKPTYEIRFVRGTVVRPDLPPKTADA